MSTIDKALIIRKLRALQQQIPAFQKSGPSVAKTAAFRNWENEIERWLEFGTAHTDRELFRFRSISFQVPGAAIYEEFDSEPTATASFQHALEQCDHLLTQAIENLELGLEHVEQAVAGTPLVNINNVITVNFAQVLESLATEIEKHNPAEGRTFRDTLKRWFQDPELWTAIIKAGQTILTAQS